MNDRNGQISRRDALRMALGVGAGLALRPRDLRAHEAWWEGLQPANIITRAIPSTGERVPIIGLGSSATFGQVARSPDVGALKEVMRTLVEKGGAVFDTAPAYGGSASEEVAGRVARELGITDKIFWATKVNVAPMGGGAADPTAARAQLETSFQRIGKRPIDLIQVHNMADVPTQLGMLKEMKKEGRVRYIGVTSTAKQQYAQLETVMRNEPLDFIGIDYAIDNREIEATILPLARERKIGVLVYMPFGRMRLWRRVSGREVPAWASEFDAKTWAQFFLKFVASHPDVTAITPATSQVKNMADNLGAAVGKLPNAEQRKRMIELVDALPPAA